jgi:signal transduction histidine kinase
VALEGESSKDELEAALRSASEETDRLVQLAEDLLLLAQFDRSTLPLRIAATDARELAERVASRFALRGRGSGRRIVVQAPKGLSLRVDPMRLEQALGNLVDNALRHGSGTVTLAVVRTEEAVELHVRDEGPGIPPEFRALAFERFSRDDAARQGGGTGLGLAIVAVIAHVHDGEAIIGRGADVYLRLPAVSGPIPPPQPGCETPSPTARSRQSERLPAPALTRPR